MKNVITKRQCPKCKRNLVKVRVRGGSGLFFVPRNFKGTFKYWKCRVCQYREADIGRKVGKVLTRSGGALAE